jgi:hypothetical protein
VKLEVAVLVPSLTEMVISVVPVWLFAGVMVTVRFWSVPPNTRLAFGTRVVEDETAETTRFAAAVSASFTVNEMGPVAWFKVPVWPGIAEIVGVWLPGVR